MLNTYHFQITIFGESAGGTSTFMQLASPRSAGLYEKAIVQSAWSPINMFQDDLNYYSR